MRARMLICHCNGITEREIRALARSTPESAGDALGVSRDCGAGQGCGGCLRQIVQIVADERAQLDRAGHADPVLAAG